MQNLITKQQGCGAVYDLVVIGGGPAGMMAAITAAQKGKKVLLLEKNKRLGEKLRITGGGRCNVTNNKPVVRDILSQYKEAGKFLFSTFMQYSVTDTVTFFADRGLDFIEENEGRMFPKTQSAQSVFDVLYQELISLGVVLETDSVVGTIVKKDNSFVISIKGRDSVVVPKVILSTGGSSRPETGSTGDALPWLARFGHTIHAVDNALVPVITREPWIAGLAGVSLSTAKVTLYSGAKKQSTHKGKLLFTHTGLSGPLILNLSKKINDLLQEDTVTIKIDVVPDQDEGEVQKKLQSLFVSQSNKKVKNVVSEIIGASFVKPVLAQAGVDGEESVHSVTAISRKKIGVAIKSLLVTVMGLLGADKAVVSSGGVELSEIDFKTMESRLAPGLFVVGDVLNINRPSGGYSLQLCWSTGFVAGFHV